MRQRWWMVGGFVAVAAVVAVFVVSGNDEGPAPASSMPSSTTTVQPAPARGAIVDCPVDMEICEFAAKAEAWVPEADAESLIADGSAWDNPNDIGILERSIENTLPEVAWAVRLASIGCPHLDGLTSCTSAFSLTFTTLNQMERTSPNDSSAILTLGFTWRPGENPVLNSVGAPQGNDRGIALRGGKGAGCNLSGLPARTSGECIITEFFAVTVEHPTAVGEPPECSALARICARALEVERQLASGDYAAVAGTTTAGAGGLESEIRTVFGTDPPRLIGMGCPFGDVRANCVGPFALAFTTLDPADDWTTGGKMAVIRFDWSPGGPIFLDVLALEDADSREAAVRGGFATRPCGLAGIAPGHPCPGATFVRYWSSAPFEPAGLPETVTLRLRPAMPLPVASTLFTATARCWACDEPDQAIQRHQVLASTGEVITATILETGKGVLDGWSIGQVISGTPDSFVLVVMVCDAGYCGALGSEKPEATWRVLVSRDQGGTWTEAFRIRTEYASIQSVTSVGIVVRTFRSDPGGALQSFYVIRGTESREVTPPAGLPPRPDATLLADGSVAWIPLSDDGLVVGGLRDESGAKLPIALPAGAQHPTFGVLAVGTLWAAWYQDGPKLGVFKPSGELAVVYDVGDAFRPAITFETLGIGTVAMTGEDGSVPAILDLEAGTITPIGAPFGTILKGRNRIIAFRPGI